MSERECISVVIKKGYVLVTLCRKLTTHLLPLFVINVLGRITVRNGVSWHVSATVK